MLTQIRRSVLIALVFLVGLGIIYPLVGTGVAQLFFRHQADGSLSAQGSTLIGQNWSATRCPGHRVGTCVFHGRPDDTGPYAADPKQDVAGGDNPLVANGNDGESAATNLGPRSTTLLQNTKDLVNYWHTMGVAHPTPDLVTTSGSGIDPDITPADALVQVPMVARATGIPAPTLRALIARETNSAQLGFLGSSYLNVLQLNEALTALK